MPKPVSCKGRKKEHLKRHRFLFGLSRNVNIHKEATEHALRRTSTVEPVTSILSQVRKLKKSRG
jgi:hypothetical protein